MATRSEAAYPLAWKNGRVASLLVTVDHKRIGKLYIGTSIVFLALGGLLAILMRAQLTTPNGHVVGSRTFAELTTMFGTTMVYLVVIPTLAGLGSFLVPLMIGARKMAFPRLHALSYWLFLLGGIVLWLSWFAKGGPAHAAWWSYPTLNPSMPWASTGHGSDYWILAIQILTLSSVFFAINVLVTIHNMRTAGMTRRRTPVFVWAMEIYSALLVVAMATIAAAVTLLLLDRHEGTHFFVPSDGGSVLLHQRLFWFAGRPATYFVIVPALGVIAEILPVFFRKPVLGKKAAALAALALALFSVVFVAHYVLGSGPGLGLDGWIVIASMVVAVPTAITVFGWLGASRRNIGSRPPVMFSVGSLSLFTLGGVMGILLAAFIGHWSWNYGYYVVSFFHHVLFGGILFALFAGLYYWWPKMFGRTLDQRLAKAHFWLLFVGSLLAFVPMFLLGLLGPVATVNTYSQGGRWELYNVISTVGFGLAALSILVFFANVWITHALRMGARVGNDPWMGDTLEWYTSSPPPAHNFDSVPPVTSARPLDDLRRRLAEEVS